MAKRLSVVLILLALVVAVPLLLRRDTLVATAGAGEDRLVIITPHIDSIRSEFGEAFAAHWKEKTGRSLFVDWRVPGGTGDVMRVINGAFAAAEDLGREGTELDVFFGGGTKEFVTAAKAGHLAELEVFTRHPEWFAEAVIPASFSGETYYDPGHRWVGVCVSQFGIVFNLDAIGWLGVAPPRRWQDLAGAAYFGRLALADPTKSSSATQAFEMMVQEQMQAAIRERGDGAEAREDGWKRGLNLLQALAANARYFTDSSSKIPYDVAQGDAAAGTAIDFYGRALEDAVRGGNGRSRLRWVAPPGGTSLSVDPVAVLRGAPNMAIAQEFVNFSLSERGQLLWNYRPGTPGGPARSALRRLPVRRDLYTPERLENFSDPDALPYERTGKFVYQPELTKPAFDALRLIFRAMCMDPHEELRRVWETNGEGPPPADSPCFDISPVSYDKVMSELVPLIESGDALELTRRTAEISAWFRANYRSAAGKGGPP